MYTESGNAHGAACVFPFVYKKTTYNECQHDWFLNLWCCTVANCDKNYKWGNCKENGK